MFTIISIKVFVVKIFCKIFPSMSSTSANHAAILPVTNVTITTLVSTLGAQAVLADTNVQATTDSATATGTKLTTIIPVKTQKLQILSLLLHF